MLVDLDAFGTERGDRRRRAQPRCSGRHGLLPLLWRPLQLAASARRIQEIWGRTSGSRRPAPSTARQNAAGTDDAILTPDRARMLAPVRTDREHRSGVMKGGMPASRCRPATA